MRMSPLGDGLRVPAAGLGGSGMSDSDGPAHDADSLGHNELLIGRAPGARRDQAVLSVKFGALRGADGRFLGLDTRPAAVKSSLEDTCRELGIGLTAYRVLAHGLLTGGYQPRAGSDPAHLPWSAPGNVEVNLALVALLDSER